MTWAGEMINWDVILGEQYIIIEREDPPSWTESEGDDELI